VAEAIYCDCCPLLPNRLCYPEFLPEQANQYFYNDVNELVPKLKFVLDQPGDANFQIKMLKG